MNHQMEFSEHFLSTSVSAVLGSRWRGKLHLEEDPKQETTSAKSNAGTPGLEVVQEVDKEEGRMALDHVGDPNAALCS